jgi:iron(III) transport system ATP-binding protein
LFAAEFMGVNNRIEGTVEGVVDGHVQLKIGDVTLEGKPSRPGFASGQPAVGVIRVEHVRLVPERGPNRVAMKLETPMYLGERYELALRHGDWRIRAFAKEPPAAEELFVELPRDSIWVF